MVWNGQFTYEAAKEVYLSQMGLHVWSVEKNSKPFTYLLVVHVASPTLNSLLTAFCTAWILCVMTLLLLAASGCISHVIVFIKLIRLLLNLGLGWVLELEAFPDTEWDIISSGEKSFLIKRFTVAYKELEFLTRARHDSSCSFSWLDVEFPSELAECLRNCFNVFLIPLTSSWRNLKSSRQLSQCLQQSYEKHWKILNINKKRYL